MSQLLGSAAALVAKASICGWRWHSTAPLPHSQRLLHFCVVGTGPAGFYTADRLLKKYGEQVHVSLLDRLPTPFGLIRSGVAPDHQDTKNVINQFSATAADARISFFGNLHVGRDVQLSDLRQRFHAVVLATGAESDKRLGVPGEAGPGVFSAREFVWWYNGHPDARDLPLDLRNVRSVAVCGIGNVALDCARLLLRPPSSPALATSDLAAHAAAVLRGAACLADVHLVARRGPVQAACTPMELKELLREPGLTVHASQAQLAVSTTDQAEMKGTRLKRRVYDLITQAVQAGPAAAAAASGTLPPRHLHFQFYRQPKEVLRDPSTGAVTGLKVEITALQQHQSGSPAVAMGTGVMEVIPADLVLISIGYRSLPIPGAPFDASRGLIPNSAGRVLTCSATPPLLPPIQPSGASLHPNSNSTQGVEAGLYVCGWIKRGPTGIIGTNLLDAEDTVASIAADLECGLLPPPRPDVLPGAAGLHQLLAAGSGGPVVDWAGWERINTAEKRLGRSEGKVREKMVSTSEMLDVAGGGASSAA